MNVSNCRKKQVALDIIQISLESTHHNIVNNKANNPNIKDRCNSSFDMKLTLCLNFTAIENRIAAINMPVTPIKAVEATNIPCINVSLLSMCTTISNSDNITTRKNPVAIPMMVLNRNIICFLNLVERLRILFARFLRNFMR